jgi:hypothetical protein
MKLGKKLRRKVLSALLAVPLLLALSPLGSHSEAPQALRLAIVEGTLPGSPVSPAPPASVPFAATTLPNGLSLVLTSPAGLERMEARGARVRGVFPFDPDAQYATVPAGGTIPPEALYADGEIVFLATRLEFPAGLERSEGFRRVSNRELARALWPREPRPSTEKALVYDPYIASFVSQVSTSRLTADDQRLVAFHTRATLSDSVYAASQWIKGRFQALGYADVQEQTFTYQTTTQRNIVVTLPGTVHPDQYIIVDGHYDSTSPQSATNAPGADDNGTGIAALLELARLVQGIPFDYSIRFIGFAAEEQGLIGSGQYAQMALATGMQIKLLVNLDMLGYPPAGSWSTIVERDQGNAVSTNDAASYAYADTMAQAALAYTSLSVTHGNIYSSDYMPFESRGFVCIGAFEQGDNPNYHTTGDIASAVNFPYVTDNVKMVLATLMHVARVSDPNPPVIQAPATAELFEGQNVTFTVTGSDLDNDPLTFGARHLPAGASYDSTGTRVFSWTPSLSQGGVYNVLFIVNDGRGRSDSTTTVISVLDQSPRIVATDPTPWQMQVAANTAIDADFDQDLDPATITPDAVRVHGAQSGPHSGVVAYDPGTRRLTFTPASPFRAGEAVTVTFTRSIKAATGYNHEGHTLEFAARALLPSSGAMTTVATLAAGNTPLGIVAADLDGDGGVDLAGTNFYGNSVFLSWNAGNLTFTPGTLVPAGTGPQGITAADLDGDGRIDLAVTLYSVNKVAVLWNEGNRTFSGPTLLTTAVGPRALVAADLDGDGRLDLATVNGLSDNASILRNLGTRSFAAQAPFAVGDDPYSLVASDSDGDGDLDLQAVKSSVPRVVVLPNLGNASFGAPVGYSAGTSPFGIAAGDVNGDGASDLAAANGGSGNVSVLVNDTHGLFGAPANYGAGNQPRAVVLADLTGDGYPDLAVSNGYSDNVSVLLNAANGAFLPASNTAVGDTPRALAAADLDNDGDVDLVTANSVTGNVTVLRNGPPSEVSGLAPGAGPSAPILFGNCPNPFPAGTVIRFRLPTPMPVDLGIYDVQGRCVRRLWQSTPPAGEHRVAWNGTDAAGRPVASGPYLYRLAAGGTVSSRMMILAR